MNNWQSRLVAACLLWLAAEVHREATAGTPSTEWWMLAYHGSAATMEWMLFLCLPWLLRGELLRDMQHLAIVCMAINALGWALYMAYYPPYVNDVLIGVMAYVQYGRLFMGDNNARDLIRPRVVRRSVS